MGEGDKCKCYIKYVGAQPLNLTDQSLEHGKFTKNPLSQIDSGTDTGGYKELFYATGRDGAAYGATGSVTYQATDGTSFTINFDSPYGSSDPRSKNYITADGGTSNWNFALDEYSDNDHFVIVKYHITEND